MLFCKLSIFNDCLNLDGVASSGFQCINMLSSCTLCDRASSRIFSRIYCSFFITITIIIIIVVIVNIIVHSTQMYIT
jgi:hypothetical protein